MALRRTAGTSTVDVIRNTEVNILSASQKYFIQPGEIFGRLTVIGDQTKDHLGLISHLCKCSCGQEILVAASRLRSGNTKSCGCLKRDRLIKHGYSRKIGSPEPTYRTWRAMLVRCRDKKSPYHGKRGVTVCDRWHDFRNFLEDMGQRPSGHSLDRIDNNGNYCPENCRWATPETQIRNSRATKLNLVSVCIMRHLRRRGLSTRELAAAFGVSERTASSAISGKRHWKDIWQ